ncbi:hypothetical protein BH23THE1_BH23THE1_33450 [soil metagenome]
MTTNIKWDPHESLNGRIISVTSILHPQLISHAFGINNEKKLVYISLDTTYLENNGQLYEVTCIVYRSKKLYNYQHSNCGGLMISPITLGNLALIKPRRDPNHLGSLLRAWNIQDGSNMEKKLVLKRLYDESVKLLLTRFIDRHSKNSLNTSPYLFKVITDFKLLNTLESYKYPNLNDFQYKVISSFHLSTHLKNIRNKIHQGFSETITECIIVAEKYFILMKNFIPQDVLKTMLDCLANYMVSFLGCGDLVHLRRSIYEIFSNLCRNYTDIDTAMNLDLVLNVPNINPTLNRAILSTNSLAETYHKIIRSCEIEDDDEALNISKKVESICNSQHSRKTKFGLEQDLRFSTARPTYINFEGNMWEIWQNMEGVTVGRECFWINFKDGLNHFNDNNDTERGRKLAATTVNEMLNQFLLENSEFPIDYEKPIVFTCVSKSFCSW